MSTKFERLVYMDAAIRSKRYPSVQTFVDRFEVSQRTVYEDVQFLKRRFSAPLAYDRNRGGYFYTDTAWALPTFLATEGELLALFLSIELAHRYLGTSFEEPLREAIEHLMGLLPSKVQVSLSEVASHFSVRQGATAQAAPETLLALHRAIEERHPVDMMYFTAGRGEETQRVVHPYHLLNVRGEWQLIAYDRYRQAIRQFALPRIRQWHILEHEQFQVDAEFSPEQYFAQSFQAEHGNNPVEVVVRFDAYQARFIREREWHTGQQIEPQPDGGLVLRFTTGALGEVRRWVMSFGRHAMVLAPEELARSVAEETMASAQQYARFGQTADISQ